MTLHYDPLVQLSLELPLDLVTRLTKAVAPTGRSSGRVMAELTKPVLVDFEPQRIGRIKEPTICKTYSIPRSLQSALHGIAFGKMFTDSELVRQILEKALPE
jgi:hypothetical protein